MTYRCDAESEIGACEVDTGVFRHEFERNHPRLDGDDIFGCVRVIPEAGIADSDSACHPFHVAVPDRRIGSLISVETDAGVERFRETSLWTDATGHRLFLRRDNPRTERPDRLEGAEILYFHRPTCSSCLEIKPTVGELSRYVRVVAVDADRSPELVRRFGVSGVPALVTVKNGRATGRITQVKRVVEILRRCATRALRPT